MLTEKPCAPESKRNGCLLGLNVNSLCSIDCFVGLFVFFGGKCLFISFSVCVCVCLSVQVRELGLVPA